MPSTSSYHATVSAMSRHTKATWLNPRSSNSVLVFWVPAMPPIALAFVRRSNQVSEAGRVGLPEEGVESGAAAAHRAGGQLQASELADAYEQAFDEWAQAHSSR